MDNSNYRISNRSLPTKLPFVSTALYTFLMHYFNASDWLWGIYGTLMLIIWIAAIVAICQQKWITINDFLKQQER